MSIINFEALEEPIVYIEKYLVDKGYNNEEIQLIYKQLNARLTKRLQNIRASEMSDTVLGKIPLGGLIKKFKKDE